MSQAAPETIWGNFRRHWWKFATGFAFLLATNWFFAELPKLIGQAVDLLNVLAGQPKDTVSHGDATRKVAPLVALFLGYGTAMMITRIGSRFTIFNAGRTIEYEIRGRLFQHVLSLPMLTLNRLGVGDVMSRLTNDLGNVRALFGFGVLNVVNAPVLFAMVVIQMVQLSPRLTLLALLPVPLLFFIVRVYGAPLFALSRDIGMKLGQMTGSVQESLSQMTTITLYNQQAAKQQAFEDRCGEFLGLNLRVARARGILFPGLESLVGAGTLLVMYVGGRMAIEEVISVGTFIAFSVYLTNLDQPVRMFGFVFSTFQRGRGALSRVNDLLSLTPDLSWGTHEDPEAFRRGIALEDITLTFGERPVLQGLSLSVNSGEMIGITGPVGCGKSALLNVVARVLEPDGGTLALGGVRAGDFTAAAYRAGVGYCTQEPFLFADTLRENIRFAEPGADDERVHTVAQLAGLGDDLQRFDKGLDTVVGERGITLSGGQKQRVGLARTLMVKPPVLLLDDSFSAVDTVTEEKIIKGLRAEKAEGRRTILFATHRLSAMPHCDRVYVLDQGRIVQTGTHEELLTQPGLYADLWRRQKLEEALEEEAS